MLSSKLAGWCVMLAAIAAFAAAQDTVTVEGVVANKVTGGGIEGATVRIWTESSHYDGRTNNTGNFQISGIKPGDYTSSAEKTGFFPADPGVVLGDRVHLRLAASADPVRLRFELNPPGVLRGRVTGADGNPAQATVNLGQGRTATTDTEGKFTFDNLAPGPYMLLASPTATEPISVQDGVRTQVVPTFYPAVLDRSQAESIAVRAGSELNGYEIRLRSEAVYRVRGVVLDAEGKPAPKATVHLHERVAGGSQDAYLFASGARSFYIANGPFALDFSSDDPVVAGDDGTFELPSVRAGEWTLWVEFKDGRDEARHRDLFDFGSATFTLGRADLDGLKIQVAKPFSLSGTIAMSDGSAVPAGVFVGVSLIADNGHSSAGGNNEPGVLRFNTVIPGTYQIRADVLSGNYYADSILFGSSNIAGQNVEVTPASPPIKVILKPAATIRGTIEDAGSGTVILFPRDLMGLGYLAPSGAGKSFELDGVPPGDYYAIALDHFDQRTMAEATVLRGLVPRAASIRVEPGATSSLNLHVYDDAR